MKEKEKLLFCQICLTFILTRGRGLKAKPPDDILKFAACSLSPKQLWKKSSAMVKSRVKDYCEIWDLPFSKWKAYLERDWGKATKKRNPISKEIAGDIKLESDKKEDKPGYKEFCQCPNCRLARSEEESKSITAKAIKEDDKRQKGQTGSFEDIVLSI